MLHIDIFKYKLFYDKTIDLEYSNTMRFFMHLNVLIKSTIYNQRGLD